MGKSRTKKPIRPTINTLISSVTGGLLSFTAARLFQSQQASADTISGIDEVALVNTLAIAFYFITAIAAYFVLSSISTLILITFIEEKKSR